MFHQIKFNRLEKNKKIRIILITIFSVILYAINRHYLRPYVFQQTNNEIIRFLFNVLPNIIGVFPLYYVSKYFLNHTLNQSCIYIIILAIAYEILHISNYETSFDIYDIVSSAITVFLIFIYEKINNSIKNII